MRNSATTTQQTDEQILCDSNDNNSQIPNQKRCSHCPAPFSTDSESVQFIKALKESNWKPIKLSDASSSSDSSTKRSIRIYSDGVYDLFHNGHAEQLRQAKTAFPNTHLIVGVCNDEDVMRFKGTRPVMTTTERSEIIRHCRYVDEVYVSPPFYPTIEFIDRIKVDLVAHDALPYISLNYTDCYECFKKSDRFLATKRTPFISTSDLLKRILDNLGVFQEREKARTITEQTIRRDQFK